MLFSADVDCLSLGPVCLSPYFSVFSLFALYFSDLNQRLDRVKKENHASCFQHLFLPLCVYNMVYMVLPAERFFSLRCQQDFYFTSIIRRPSFQLSAAIWHWSFKKCSNSHKTADYFFWLTSLILLPKARDTLEMPHMSYEKGPPGTSV